MHHLAKQSKLVKEKSTDKLRTMLVSVFAFMSVLKISVQIDAIESRPLTDSNKTITRNRSR